METRDRCGHALKAAMASTPQLSFTSRRSPVLSTHGMCCTSQPLASEAGLRILKAGGNAADAAVAAVAALNVTEACMCGLGGDAFCLYYDASTKTVRGLNGSGRAPQALTLETARAVAGDGNRLPAESVHCVTVPDAAACWADCVSEFGRLSLKDVLAPAIKLCEEGVPIHAIAAQLWSDNAHQLLDRWGGLEGNPGAASLLVDGRPPAHGEALYNTELGWTFRKLAAQGAEGFYKGAVAEAIVKCVRDKGGVLSLDDLAAHVTERVEPLSTTFRGKTVYELPPNGSGLMALMALATLNELPPSSGRPEDVLRQVEALRLAFAKGLADIGDGVPASADAHLIEARAASEALENLGTDTTYLCCVDKDGNACSFICSNFEAFGSGLVPGGTGFSLQNRGRNFLLQEGHPNCIGPGKRPYHTIIPGMVTNGDEFYAAFGVMGGFMQPQGHVQVLSSLLDRGMDPQAALDAPRFCIAPAAGDLQDKRSDTPWTADGSLVVHFEEGFSREVADVVDMAGYRVVRGVSGHARRMFGRGQCIVARPDGSYKWKGPGGGHGCILWGGSDGRGDGCAAGY